MQHGGILGEYHDHCSVVFVNFQPHLQLGKTSERAVWLGEGRALAQTLRQDHAAGWAGSLAARSFQMLLCVDCRDM